MLLLLPTPSVPLLVALALLLTTLGRRARAARVARDRVLLSVADAWFALAPALVLVAGRRADAGLERLARLRGSRSSPRSALDSVDLRRRACGRASASARAPSLAELLHGPPRRRAARRRSACSPPSPPPTSRTRCCSCVPLVGLFTIFAARAHGARRADDRALRRLPRHRAAARRRDRGRRRLHRPAHPGRGRAHRRGRRPARRRRRDAPRRRVRRAAARRRQGRDPERDHQQARARSTTRSGRS